MHALGPATRRVAPAAAPDVLFEQFVEHGEDSIRGRTRLPCSVAVEHLDPSRVRPFLQEANPIGDRFRIRAVIVAPELEAGKKSLSFTLLCRVFDHIAHEEHAAGTIAILDGECRAIEGEADTPPSG